MISSAAWLFPLLVSLLFGGAGCVLDDTAASGPPVAELQCRSTAITAAGWREVVASTDPDVCAHFGTCPRFFTYCGETPDVEAVSAQWESLVAEVVATSFRNQSGFSCVTATRCQRVATFADDETTRPECREPSAATALEPCAEGTGCLSVSRGAIDFGYVETGDVGPAQIVRVSNVCEEPLQLVADQRYTCDDATLCTECNPDSRACDPEIVVLSDCLPTTPEELERGSKTLLGTTSVDLLARSCQISVAFQPAERGDRSARKVVSTESGESYSIHLSGSGLGGMAGFLGPEEEVCRDPSWVPEGRDCTPLADNVEVAVQSLGPRGRLLVREALLSDEEVGFRVVATERVSPDGAEPVPVELPIPLAVGEELHLAVRWCGAWRTSTGLADEVTILTVNTDDLEIGPGFSVNLRWAPGGCS